MTAKQRREYWLKVERMRLKLERKYSVRIGNALRDQISSFRQGYASNAQEAISDMTLQLWNAELLKVINDLYRETWTLFASSTYNTLRRENLKFTGMGVNEVWQQEVREFLARHGLQMVVTISGNSRDLLLKIVNDAIQEGITQGLGAEEVSRLIVDRLGDERYVYTAYRAERIARTETVRAANEGHMSGARQLPFEVKKVWIAAKDSRTRRIPEDQWDHWTLDGAEQELNGTFSAVSKRGVQISVKQPGDAKAPAGFTINCRCRVAFQGKRDSNGRLITKR
jgi:Phage Mu protein F like protein